MSKSLDPVYHAATVTDFPPEWIASVRAALKRDGQATRSVGICHKSRIEVQSINTGEWMPLNLPTNSCFFANDVDRDSVLELLVGKKKK